MKMTRSKCKPSVMPKGLSPFLSQNSSPALKCRFDSTHALYKRMSDEKPLLEVNCRGSFRLPILHFLVALAAGFVMMSLFLAAVERKICRKKK